VSITYLACECEDCISKRRVWHVIEEQSLYDAQIISWKRIMDSPGMLSENYATAYVQTINTLTPAPAVHCPEDVRAYDEQIKRWETIASLHNKFPKHQYNFWRDRYCRAFAHTFHFLENL